MKRRSHKKEFRLGIIVLLTLAVLFVTIQIWQINASAIVNSGNQINYTTIQNAIVTNGAKWIAKQNFAANLTQEKKSRLASLKKPKASSQEPAPLTSLPSSFDWRSYNGKNWMTAVKDQGDCGDCGVLSVLGVVEAKYNIEKTKTPNPNFDLSEQDLLSCNGGFGSCSKGFEFEDLAAYMVHTGVSIEACFKYTATDLLCSQRCTDWATKTIKALRYTTTSSLKQALVTEGPLAVTFDVYDDFFYYSSGIYSHVQGDLIGQHGMVLVGYDDANKYWIVKNSWGTAWGEAGYAKIKYGQGIEKYIAYSVSFKASSTDATKPSISVSTANGYVGGPAGYVLPELTIILSDSGGLSKLITYVDGKRNGPIMTYGASIKNYVQKSQIGFESEAEALKKHGYYLVIVDQAGNVNRYPQTGMANLPTYEDKTKPTAAISATPTTVQPLQEITFAIKASDNYEVSKVSAFLDNRNLDLTNSCKFGGKTANCTYKLLLTEAGAHTFFAIVKDRAGNELKTQTITIFKIIETTKPTVSVSFTYTKTSPTQHNPLTGQPVKIVAQASDNQAVTTIDVYMDNSKKSCAINAASGTCTMETTFAQAGTHTYYAVAKDTSGNSARDPASGTKSFTIITKTATYE